LRDEGISVFLGFRNIGYVECEQKKVRSKGRQWSCQDTTHIASGRGLYGVAWLAKVTLVRQNSSV